MKALIFDSGPLINLSINGLLDIIEKMKKIFDGKFLITTQVKEEVYDKPLRIQQFELGALRIAHLIERKILESPESLGVSEQVIAKGTGELMEEANHAMKTEGKWITLVSEAEMSCLALAEELKKKNIGTMIAIDERTTRMLGENPENLAKLMSERLRKNVRLESDVNSFRSIRFIRSSELVYVAYKNKLIDLTNEKALEALLYATKFKGAAISWDEINVLKKL